MKRLPDQAMKPISAHTATALGLPPFVLYIALVSSLLQTCDAVLPNIARTGADTMLLPLPKEKTLFDHRSRGQISMWPAESSLPLQESPEPPANLKTHMPSRDPSKASSSAGASSFRRLIEAEHRIKQGNKYNRVVEAVRHYHLEFDSIQAVLEDDLVNTILSVFDISHKRQDRLVLKLKPGWRGQWFEDELTKVIEITKELMKKRETVSQEAKSQNLDGAYQQEQAKGLNLEAASEEAKNVNLQAASQEAEEKSSDLALVKLLIRNKVFSEAFTCLNVIRLAIRILDRAAKQPLIDQKTLPITSGGLRRLKDFVAGAIDGFERRIETITTHVEALEFFSHIINVDEFVSATPALGEIKRLAEDYSRYKQDLVDFRAALEPLYEKRRNNIIEQFKRFTETYLDTMDQRINEIIEQHNSRDPPPDLKELIWLDEQVLQTFYDHINKGLLDAIITPKQGDRLRKYLPEKFPFDLARLDRANRDSQASTSNAAKVEIGTKANTGTSPSA